MASSLEGGEVGPVQEEEEEEQEEGEEEDGRRPPSLSLSSCLNLVRRNTEFTRSH